MIVQDILTLSPTGHLGSTQLRSLSLRPACPDFAPHLQLDDAREGVLARVKELDAEKADRELRSFMLTMRVNPDYHPKIIGRKGAVISKIRLDYEVNVQFPQKGVGGVAWCLSSVVCGALEG